MKTVELKDLGKFIKKLREGKNLTQSEFARMLNTSQPVVARIEKGEQNMTVQSLSQIGEVLNNPLVAIAPASLDFEIEGGHELSGSIETNTSKNGAMGLLCGSLLNKGTTTLHGIPRIEEVNRIIEVLISIGVKIKWTDKNTLEIQRPKILLLENINVESASRTRTILMFIGAIIHEFEESKIPHSQGCTLGTRTITPHLNGLKEMGIDILVKHDHYQILSPLPKTTSYPDIEIVMSEASDTGAELLLIAAAKYPGKTTIEFAPSNYMVQEVCYFLADLGVKIEGVGTHKLTVQGVKEIKQNIEYFNSEDPIESMMFISAALVTKSELTITRSPIDYLKIEIQKLKEMGAKFTISKVYKSKNKRTNLVDIVVHKLIDEKGKEYRLSALHDKISCGPYPALNIDNLPFFVPVCALAEGRSLIHDWVYEVRSMHFLQLNSLGANIEMADPHRVYINGLEKFKPGQVVCPPALRPAMIVLLAMLSAKGTSRLYNVYSINRGYEDIMRRLNEKGAKIKMI
ncbi:MAG: helix-turn-helix domain-containing protein [Patescibacteria group bacterium]